MGNVCPKTGEACAVLINVGNIRQSARTSQELSAIDSLEATIGRLLTRGNCSGSHSEDGFTYCASDRLPDVAQTLDQTEADFPGYTELFGIENLGRMKDSS